MKTFKQYILEQLSSKELAVKLEVSEDDINKMDRNELDTLLKWVGEHDFVSDSKFDPEELALGIKVEHEHTSNAIIAKLIAKDHLTELPDYYSRLKKMENE